jgi:excisionase family DNA binding protein
MPTNYVPPRVAASRLGVSTKTLERWLEAGKIEGIFTQGGQRRYNLDSVIPVRPGNPRDERATVLYARVSSRSQRTDLEQQVNFLKSRYPDAEIITDIGSGLNFKRKGLQALLDRVLNNTIKLIVVAHKDRLCRFGFDIISWLCTRQQTKILVLDQKNLGAEREMVEDILAIVHVFSCRLYGLRKYKKQISEDSELPSVSGQGTHCYLEEMGSRCPQNI